MTDCRFVSAARTPTSFSGSACGPYKPLQWPVSHPDIQAPATQPDDITEQQIMKTAIIGLGSIGSKVAANLTTGGEHVIVADHGLSKAEGLAAQLGANATAMPVHAAFDEADVLILAIPFEAMKDLVASRRETLAGKIIVDPSNPIAPDGKGGFRKTIPAEQSSGEIIAGLLPEGAELVKAFGTLGAESLGSAVRLAGMAVADLTTGIKCQSAYTI